MAETHGGVADPTPMMKDVRVFPRGGGKQLIFKMCPDTGCTMTLIAENVVTRQGMTVNTRSKKRVRAVNGQRLNNSGMVTFGIEYQGQTTEVEALVSSSIEDEVLLSWQVLKKLGVIGSSFPNIEVKAATTSTTSHPTGALNEREWQSMICGRPSTTQQICGQTNAPVPRLQGYCLTQIPTGSKCFAVFDCTHGYWQIPLAEKSRPYTGSF